MTQEYWIGIGQDALQIELPTGLNMSTSASVHMKYRKPSGIEGTLTAAVSGTDNTIIVYTFVLNDPLLDEYGTWWFWPYYVASDGRSADGRPDKVKINKVGYIN